MARNNRYGQPDHRFAGGRNGIDPYSRFLLVVSCVFMGLSLLSQMRGWRWVALAGWCAALGVFSWSVWRSLSRDTVRRQRENQRFLSLWRKIDLWFRLQRERYRYRKDYDFFRCPGCRSLVRVPRGKGHIRITCRRCGFSFHKKT